MDTVRTRLARRLRSRPTLLYGLLDTGLLEADSIPPAAADLAGRGVGLLQLRAKSLPTGRVRVIAASYEMLLEAERAERVRRRLAELTEIEAWTVVRGRAGREDRRPRAIDLKGRVRDLALDGRRLSFTLLAGVEPPARCLDVLVLLELAGQAPEDSPRGAGAGEALAALVRTDIECRFDASKDAERNMDV